MKKLLLAILALVLLSFGCANKDELNVALDDSLVELASEAEPVSSGIVPLKASFMSDGKTFSYVISYNGKLMELMDVAYKGASAFGPSFKVSGGAELTGSTVLLEVLGDVEAKAGASTRIGDFDVYEYVETALGCDVHKGLIPFGTEVLQVQTRVCAGQDGILAKQAFTDAISDLRFKVL
ncbi:MAG: hypothetical protein WC897_03865 [Candidatus Gracilibacteria bacterium]